MFCHLFGLRSTLLALMSVLSQSLLTLVRRHLVPLMLLSVGIILGVYCYYYYVYYIISDCKVTIIFRKVKGFTPFY